MPLRPFLLATLLLGCARLGLAAETLAVPDFENRSSRAELDFLGRTLSDALSQPLVETHGFVLVERQRLSEVFKEKGLALAGALGDSAAQAPLALLAADDLVLGSYEGTSSALKVSLRAVRISDARLMGAFGFEGNLDKVLAEMKAAADQIEGILHGRAFGFLDLESDPAGLEVRIDGMRAGTAPLRHARLLAGPHEVAVVSGGQVLWRDSLTLEPGRTVLRRAEVRDPQLRQGVSLAFGTGLLEARTPDREIGPMMDFRTLLEARRGAFSFGLRGCLTTRLERSEAFDIPYGTGTEERSFQVAEAGLEFLWHLPQLGPFELGIGAEGGRLWSWDRHPAWRTDLASRTVRNDCFVAGPLAELVWVSGSRLELLLAGSMPVTLTSWRRDRIVRQDLFPVSTASNLVLEQDKGPLMLPAVDLAVRVHL